ncbi:Exodeoxyribonuclease I subunit D [Acetoanaerobium noterae]|uniref:Nuclease SbcCD subunit D n=1 Tax=Acetoanaerobium noterae TaxID=745369 RepID=A0A1T5BIE7_9FIRM|nr:exonuclease SbcCD subunit D [Acetoanaerobium noterae]SKB47064.1 Exodeoxyribonuclease I subunit D [Acetoanaerobium noterae]
MRIIHTGDWHLGKNLEGMSRLEEQAEFLEDFITIVEDNRADLVIIAGDVYDSFTPSAKAEVLFYNTLKRLSKDGERLILVIAGNHDSPDRLVAAWPLAQPHGIIMLGTPKSTVPIGTYGRHEVIKSEPGIVEVMIGEEKAVIAAIAFPSEKRLNEVLYLGTDEDEEKLESYEARMIQLFTELEKHYRDNTINLLVSHIFVMGSEESGSERSIQLGGSYLINSSIFPKKAQYIALGHVHKPQIVHGTGGKARYSGSPIHYNKTEINFTKSVERIDVVAGRDAVIERIALPVYKPIEVWKCENYAEALEMCEAKKDESSWVYLEIKTDEYIREDQIKELKLLKKDILSIRPITSEDIKREEMINDHRTQSFEELFQAFYIKQNKVEPSEETKETIYKLYYGEDYDNEAN